MKKIILFAAVCMMPLSMMAQDDDMYFVPSKKNVAKERARYERYNEVYYSGSDRSVDDYNRRGSYYEPIAGDSSMTDVINFSAVEGVYPDSTADFQLTKKMTRWDGYTPTDAYWEGYDQGRTDEWRTSTWHSPWYYSSYYPWYDSYWYWHDPWYYRSSWYYSWYDPWYYRPYHYYGGYYYGGYAYRPYRYVGGRTGGYVGRSNRVTFGSGRSRTGFGNASASSSRTTFGNRRTVTTDRSRTGFGSTSSSSSRSGFGSTSSSSSSRSGFGSSSSSSSSRSGFGSSSSSSSSSRSSSGGGGSRSGGGSFGRHR